MEWIQSTSEDSIFDPFIRGRLNCCNHLHRYQKDALQNIFDGVMSGKGGRVHGDVSAAVGRFLSLINSFFK